MDFDRRLIHFGFALGTNTADFHYRLHSDTARQDSIAHIDIRRQPGFHLGLISSLNLHESIHLRFMPCLSFQERVFTYRYVKNGKLKTKKNRLETTNLDFTLLLKLRTKRINNFAAYAIGGIQYSYDLASQSDVVSAADPIARVRQHDWAYQVGGGFDFWLPYFKFAIELKLSNGIRNIAIRDNTLFMHPIAALRSKIWTFSIMFEG